jgi:hypothetical protein
MMCIFPCIGDTNGKGSGWPVTLPPLFPSLQRRGSFEDGFQLKAGGNDRRWVPANSL